MCQDVSRCVEVHLDALRDISTRVATPRYISRCGEMCRGVHQFTSTHFCPRRTIIAIIELHQVPDWDVAIASFSAPDGTGLEPRGLRGSHACLPLLHGLCRFNTRLSPFPLNGGI